MKTIFTILFACTTFLISESALCQTGSDYYLPLRVGNYLNFHTNGAPSGWPARAMKDSLVGTDNISGKTYVREVGREVADNGSFNNVYQAFWLAKDSAGDVVAAAFSGTSPDLDSASILPAPMLFFPNQSLVPGYSLKRPSSKYLQVDSTISDTNTVEVPAGTFTNCLEIRETHFDSVGNVIFLENHFYARGVGMVLNQRTKPDDQAHTDELVKYSAVTSVNEKNGITMPINFSLSQNYPNPFNPSTVISYQLSAVGYVTLRVYDVLGREVATLVNQRQDAGMHSVTFNGPGLSSGVYFYRLAAGNNVITKKMILMK